MEQDIKIEWIPIEEVIPYDNNPRNNEKAVSIVAKSIEHYGFNSPIILDKNNVIIAGHTRMKAANKLGLKQVPVIWKEDLTPAQVKAYRLMDNKASEYATWNPSMLTEEFKALKELNFELDLTGFREVEIDRLLRLEVQENRGGRDPKYKIEPGQKFILGDHRLICADSTRTDTYINLLGEKKCAMVYTYPPYGVSYKGVSTAAGKNWKVIDGDDLKEDKLLEFLDNTFKEIERVLIPKSALYVFHASRNQKIFEEALNNAGFKVKQQLIWQKVMVFGRDHYHWAHEPIFYCSRHSEEPNFYGDRKDKTSLNVIDPDKMNEKKLRQYVKDHIAQSSIWAFGKDKLTDYVHPTQKPSQMAERAIINSSQKGEIVLEPFAGSGSTLIGCETTKRKCYAIELDPIFCSHIIERWEKFTKRTATLENGENIALAKEQS